MTWLLVIWRLLSGGLSALLRAIGRHPWQSAVVVLLALSAWLEHGRTDALAGKARADHQIALEISAHRQTKANYRAAQAQAQQAEQARVVRVTAEQQRITANVSSDYARRIADLRTRYDGMQRDDQARACAFGSTCGQPLPAATDAAGRTFEAASPEGLSLAERLLASEQAEQLDALITWVEQQSVVPVN